MAKSPNIEQIKLFHETKNKNALKEAESWEKVIDKWLESNPLGGLFEFKIDDYFTLAAIKNDRTLEVLSHRYTKAGWIVDTSMYRASGCWIRLTFRG